ncbi:unnamed protein product [Phyllotreta striolata]|uniref:Chitin-binding type-2 domain-containing protein n=1 Tax=Phyllotreta striolata TaxID=444603 RepID=A0A9N9XN44_PHYSR|nr:unnamed protein product [Phyllotreta striolata]
MKSSLVFLLICLPALFRCTNGQNCKGPGIIENPNVPNCRSFLWCVSFNTTSFRENVFTCPPSRSFNPAIGRCDATYQCPSSTTSSSSTTEATTSPSTNPSPSTTSSTPSSSPSSSTKP